jgi:FAD/FMN-containing dehydrogenase
VLGLPVSNSTYEADHSTRQEDAQVCAGYRIRALVKCRQMTCSSGRFKEKGMTIVALARSNRQPTAAAEVAVDELRGGFRGRLITPADADYDAARKVWNGLIDRRPSLIARCTGVADVIAAVNFASKHDLLVAVRGGGHSFPGHSVCDGGLVIDLSPMKGTRVDVANQTVRAQGGVTWGELDHETQVFGLATPGGAVSTTGIAGLTLGGGSQGWLVRRFGTTADNLLSVDIVTADGRYLRANAEENPDLFWAVRGGGGNFGVVTSFEYQLHPVGPIVLAGAAFYPWARATEITQFYLDYVTAIPDDLTTALFYWTAPPAPFLPESAHGRQFAIIAGCYAGAVQEGERAVAPLRDLKPEVDLLGPFPYVAFQAMFDPLLPHGILAYAKSDYFDEISPAAVAEMVTRAETLPSPLAMVRLNHYGGAVAAVANDATAFAHRDSAFALNVDSFWHDPAESEKNIRWTREVWEAMRAYAPRGSYVNFLTDEGEDRVRESYGGNYDRLVAVKNKYDPRNMFRQNQNIKPSS